MLSLRMPSFPPNQYWSTVSRGLILLVGYPRALEVQAATNFQETSTWEACSKIMPQSISALFSKERTETDPRASMAAQ
jgi:hypothetical protein